MRTIAVTGGKGGVGKTNVSANLAVALAGMGKRTLLLDADLGLANIDVILGLQPKHTLADLVAGRCTLEEVIIEGPGGVLVVPAASGRRHMAELQPAEHVGLVNVFSELERDLDVMIIDTAAGITDIVECGPGKVLTGLLRRTAPEINGHNIFDAASLAAVLEKLN